MHITMIKKRLANGDPCDKCAQTEDMLRRRGYWGEIDEVVWALEGDEQSAGAKLGRTHGVEVAPFFVLTSDDGDQSVYTSPLRLIRDHFSKPAAKVEAAVMDGEEVSALAGRFAETDSAEIVRFVLERFGTRCAIALTGAEDVILIDMASKSGLPFRVVFVDSGRQHHETYALIDELRRHYGIEIACSLPDADKLIELLNAKGQNSFLQDGHHECCGIRRVAPLARALRDCDAWLALHRAGRELSAPSPREIVERDPASRLIRFSPLANWDSNEIWSYIRKHAVPHNELFAKGYRQIGCQPCTRKIRPDQDDRDGLWWWEKQDGTDIELGPPGDGI